MKRHLQWLAGAVAALAMMSPPAAQVLAGGSPQGDEFQTNGGVGERGKPGLPYQGPRLPDDAECHGSNRELKDRYYGVRGRVISTEEVHHYARRMQILNCGPCGPGRMLCWLKPTGRIVDDDGDGYDDDGRGPLVAQNPDEGAGPMVRKPGDRRRFDVGGGSNTGGANGDRPAEPGGRYTPDLGNPNDYDGGQPTLQRQNPRSDQGGANGRAGGRRLNGKATRQASGAVPDPVRRQARAAGAGSVALVGGATTGCQWSGRLDVGRDDGGGMETIYICIGAGHHDGDAVTGAISSIDGRSKYYTRIGGKFLFKMGGREVRFRVTSLNGRDASPPPVPLHM